MNPQPHAQPCRPAKAAEIHALHAERIQQKKHIAAEFLDGVWPRWHAALAVSARVIAKNAISDFPNCDSTLSHMCRFDPSELPSNKHFAVILAAQFVVESQPRILNLPASGSPRTRAMKRCGAAQIIARLEQAINLRIAQVRSHLRHVLQDIWPDAGSSSARALVALRKRSCAAASADLRSKRRAHCLGHASIPAARPGSLACDPHTPQVPRQFRLNTQAPPRSAETPPASSPTPPATNRARAHAPAAWRAAWSQPGRASSSWAANTAAHATGLCLCGIVEEPPRSSLPLSDASPISGCISSATSSRELGQRTREICQALATISTRLSRCVCQGNFGFSQFQHVAPVSAATARPALPSAASVPTAPPNCRTSARCRCSIRARCRCAKRSKRTRQLQSQGRRRSRLQPGSARQHRLPMRAHLARERAVQTVLMRCSSSFRPSRICSTSAVSSTSWLVAPRWIARAARSSLRLHCGGQLPHERNGNISGVSCFALQVVPTSTKPASSNDSSTAPEPASASPCASQARRSRPIRIASSRATAPRGENTRVISGVENRNELRLVAHVGSTSLPGKENRFFAPCRITFQRYAFSPSALGN